MKLTRRQALGGLVATIAGTSVAAYFGGDEALAKRYLELGCVFTAVGSDVGLLARGAEALAARFRPSPR